MEDIVNNISKTVYETLGPGYKENIYHNAFLIELRKTDTQCQSEVICPILYNNIQIGFERADIVIYDSNEMKCVLEFKSINTTISSKEILQIRKYIKNFSIKEGYLVNFSSKLEIYYVTLDEAKKIS